MFILGLAVSWWLFLRRKQYKIIDQEHDIYDKPIYKTLAILYPILSAILFFIGLYIGYLHNSEAEHIESIHIRAEDGAMVKMSMSVIVNSPAVTPFFPTIGLC